MYEILGNLVYIIDNAENTTSKILFGATTREVCVGRSQIWDKYEKQTWNVELEMYETVSESFKIVPEEELLLELQGKYVSIIKGFKQMYEDLLDESFLEKVQNTQQEYAREKNELERLFAIEKNSIQQTN